MNLTRVKGTVKEMEARVGVSGQIQSVQLVGFIPRTWEALEKKPSGKQNRSDRQ